jgi:hypothetical protein
VFSGTWQGQIAFKKEPGWVISPAKQNFTLQAGGQADLVFEYQVDSSVFRGKYSQPLSISLPNGSRYLSAVTIPIIPVIPIPRLPQATSVADIQSWQPPGGSLLLDRIDQVVIGKPPELASLEEVDDWAGPEELSAQAKIGYDDDGILVYVKVHDVHARLPQGWPGVLGSCVEFFFDFRPADDSLGNLDYDSDVHQIVVRPVIKAGQKPAVWHASTSSAALPNLSVKGGSLDADNYWLILRIPASDIGRSFEPGMQIGFDVGVNGPHSEKAGRKSQIMLFGTGNNYSDASRFGAGMLD